MSIDASHHTLTLPADVSASRRARYWVASQLGADPRCADVVLLVSEIVTNAARHAGTPSVLSLSVGPVVRIELRDGSPALPTPKANDPASTSGRGLLLVDKLATRWGTEAVDGGKVVWFEL